MRSVTATASVRPWPGRAPRGGFAGRGPDAAAGAVGSSAGTRSQIAQRDRERHRRREAAVPGASRRSERSGRRKGGGVRERKELLPREFAGAVRFDRDEESSGFVGIQRSAGVRITE